MNTKTLIAVAVGLIAGYALSKKLRATRPWADAYNQGVKLAGVAS